MKKILANMSYILVTSIKYTGAIFAIIGFIGLFAPLTDCSSMQEGMTKKIIWSCMVLVGIWILVFLATTSFVLLKKKYKLFDVNDGHAVFVQYFHQMKFRVQIKEGILLFPLTDVLIP